MGGKICTDIFIFWGMLAIFIVILMVVSALHEFLLCFYLFPAFFSPLSSSPKSFPKERKGKKGNRNEVFEYLSRGIVFLNN